MIITPEILLNAYASGIFPMAESADDPHIFWVEPEKRGILPLDRFHIPRSLKKSFRKTRFTTRINTDFEAVVDGCAGVGTDRKETWINPQIKSLYLRLHQMGFCHSIETWSGDRLVGGLYGVSLGAAFFGESMFSVETDASKFALIELVYRLKKGGFQLLDTQFTTEHLEKFGVTEINRGTYLRLLDKAVAEPADLFAYDGGATSEVILQSFSQMS